MADTPSWLPNTIDDVSVPPVVAMLSIETDPALLWSIIDRYIMDLFCTKITCTTKSIDEIA